MKKILLFILALHFSLSAATVVDKTEFDLEAPLMGKHAVLGGNGLYYLLLTNPRTEVSLIDGGYFTIGTTGGVSESAADDACEITFGHPFAKTSYPVFSIDGKWFKMDDYFREPGKLIPFQIGDTLFIRATQPDLFSVEFSIAANQFGSQIQIRQKIVNLDTESHQIGLGLVFDPALGKWGDGCLEINESLQSNDTLLTSGTAPLHCGKNRLAPKGLGLKCKVPRSQIR